MDRRTFLTATLAAPFVDASKALAQPAAKTPSVPWTQWGGPNRNFHTDARGLKDTWPEWQVPFTADYSIAVATPVYGPDNLLFVSSEYNAGTKVIELKRNGLQTTATKLWSSKRLRLHHGNAIRIGGTIYFSNGGKGSQAILSAVDVRSGKIHWQQRTIEKATFVWADQKLITLDQDGVLMIAHLSPEGFRISAKAPLLTRLSWTPPVLVGSRLYIRDRKTMMALDLS